MLKPTEIEEEMRDVARELLSTRKVEMVIGFQEGSLPFRSRPCFIRNEQDVGKLVWNSYCSNNLAVYLPRLLGKKFPRPKVEEPMPHIGIVAKGCDARSISVLQREHQVPRENLVVIGVPCAGMSTGAALSKNKGRDPDHLPEEFIDQACIDCAQPEPIDADILIAGTARAAAETKYESVEEFEKLGPAERWPRVEEELSRCIKCYACRQACPNCYCKTCFADQTKPRWIGAGNDLSDVLIFHLMRAYHQAGRCVSCDACVRACPVGIDLALLNRKLAKDVEQMFDYLPGLSVEAPHPLSDFDEQDSQDFMIEP